MINIKADKALKEASRKLAEELGLSLSAVVTAQLKQFVKNQDLYVSAAPKMTPALETMIEEAERDLRAKRNISPVFRSGAAMDRHLDLL